jgi:hypothetical protein
MKNENLLKNVLENAGLDPEDKGSYFKFICPSCGHKEAYAYKDSNILLCSRRDKCNYKKDILSFIKEEGLTKKDILKDLSKKNVKEEILKVNKELILPEGLTFFYEKPEGIIAKKAFNYLKKRNISEDYIYKLGYIYNPEGRFGFSIFIPFYENNELVYFITRSLEGGLRYNNPQGVDGRNFVLNYDNIQYKGDVFIFEGVFDALSLRKQVGTAMLTSSLSKEQVSKIYEKAPKNIILVPDNDDAGKASIKRNIDILNLYKPPSLDINFYIYNILKEKDFNELSINNKIYEINLKDCIEYKNLRKTIFTRKKPLI